VRCAAGDVQLENSILPLPAEYAIAAPVIAINTMINKNGFRR
jgi:hypothetical protein